MTKIKTSKMTRPAIIASMVNLILIFLMNNAFLHAHITPGGKIVVHSHPFKHAAGNPDQKPVQHKHNDVELYCYSTSTDISKLILMAVPDGKHIFESRHYKKSHISVFSSIICNYDHRLRAPPVSY